MRIKHEQKCELIRMEEEKKRKEREIEKKEDGEFGKWEFFSHKKYEKRHPMTKYSGSYCSYIEYDLFVRYHKVTGKPRWRKENYKEYRD